MELDIYTLYSLDLLSQCEFFKIMEICLYVVTACPNLRHTSTCNLVSNMSVGSCLSYNYGIKHSTEKHTIIVVL